MFLIQIGRVRVSKDRSVYDDEDITYWRFQPYLAALQLGSYLRVLRGRLVHNWFVYPKEGRLANRLHLVFLHAAN